MFGKNQTFLLEDVMNLRIKKDINPFRTIVAGFSIYVIIGLILISMPFAQKTAVSLVDNLFNVVSAMSTTGLVTDSISKLYTPFGKLVILTLIQLGAIGYMTLTSFLILSGGNKISSTRIKVFSAEFAMPEGFELKQFMKHIMAYTFLVEFVGILLLWREFALLDIDKPLWSSVFHTISAFCTAGFSIYGDGLVRFQDDVSINLIICTLCWLGSIGFIVPVDIYRKLTGKTEEITFTSKIILIATVILATLGTLIYIFCADSNFIQAFFQITAASTTAGYNTVDIGLLPDSVLITLIFLMIIGASPSGTGGGIKTTSVSAVIAIITSVMRGHPDKITFLKRIIPANRVMTAAAAACAYIIMLFFFTFLLCLVENKEFIALFFETASAIGTVGLSTGITPDLTNIGKIIITVAMFFGRMGMLTLGLAFFRIKDDSNIVRKRTDLVV